jgi:hypothetical protein
MESRAKFLGDFLITGNGSADPAVVKDGNIELKELE